MEDNVDVYLERTSNASDGGDDEANDSYRSTSTPAPPPQNSEKDDGQTTNGTVTPLQDGTANDVHRHTARAMVAHAVPVTKDIGTIDTQVPKMEVVGTLTSTEQQELLKSRHTIGAKQVTGSSLEGVAPWILQNVLLKDF